MLTQPQKVFDLPDEGTHRATILRVIPKGFTKSIYGGQRDTLAIIFRIDDQKTQDGDFFEHQWDVTNRITNQTRNRKASDLYNLIRATALPPLDWNTPFDTDSLIGQKVIIYFQHVQKPNGNTFANVTGFPKTMMQQAIVIGDDHE